MVPSKIERIICAAIYLNDKKIYIHQPRNIVTGIVISGRRHHNCFAILSEITKNPVITVIQGFLTSTDKFIDRQEAAAIAFKAGQISKETSILYSEDLY